jgi:hypothetical protein
MAEDFERGRNGAEAICGGLAAQHGLYGAVHVLHASPTRMVALVKPTDGDGRKCEPWSDDPWILTVRIGGGVDGPTRYEASIVPAHRIADGPATIAINASQSVTVEAVDAAARAVERTIAAVNEALYAARGMRGLNAPAALDIARDIARHYYGLHGEPDVLHHAEDQTVAILWPHEDDDRDDGPWLLTVVESAGGPLTSYITPVADLIGMVGKGAAHG